MFFLLGGFSRAVSPTKRRPATGQEGASRSLERTDNQRSFTPDPGVDGVTIGAAAAASGVSGPKRVRIMTKANRYYHRKAAKDEPQRPHSACPCTRRHSYHLREVLSSKSNIAPQSMMSPSASDNDENAATTSCAECPACSSPHRHRKRQTHSDEQIAGNLAMDDDKQENEQFSAEQIAEDGGSNRSSCSSRDRHSSAASSSSCNSSTTSSSSSSCSGSATCSSASSDGRRSPTSPARTVSSSHRSSPNKEEAHRCDSSSSCCSSSSASSLSCQHSLGSSDGARSPTSPAQSVSTSHQSSSRQRFNDEPPVESRSSTSCSTDTSSSCSQAASVHSRSSSSQSSRIADYVTDEEEASRVLQHDYSQPSGNCTICGTFTPTGVPVCDRCESASQSRDFDSSYVPGFHSNLEKTRGGSTEDTLDRVASRVSGSHSLSSSHRAVTTPQEEVGIPVSIHDSFDVPEDEDKDIEDTGLQRPATAYSSSRHSPLYRQPSGTISSVSSEKIEQMPERVASRKEGDGTPVPQYVSPISHNAPEDERSFSFISAAAADEKAKKKESKSLSSSSSSSSTSSSSSSTTSRSASASGSHASSTPGRRAGSSSPLPPDEEWADRVRENREKVFAEVCDSTSSRHDSSLNASSTATPPPSPSGNRAVVSANKSYSSPSSGRHGVSSVELPDNILRYGRDASDDEKHSSFGTSPIDRPANPHPPHEVDINAVQDIAAPYLHHHPHHASIPPVIAEETQQQQPPSPSGMSDGGSLSSSAPVAAFIDRTNRFLERQLNAGGTASLIAERFLSSSVKALASDITPTQSPHPLSRTLGYSTGDILSESDDTDATPIVRHHYDSGYSVATSAASGHLPRQVTFGTSAPYRSSSYDAYNNNSGSGSGGGYLTRSNYLTSTTRRYDPTTDSMRDETATNGSSIAAAPERRASNDFSAYLNGGGGGGGGGGDSGSSILDGPVGSVGGGMYSTKGSANIYESSSSAKVAADHQLSSSSALQQIRRDAEQRERNIGSWLSEARRLAPSSNVTSEIEDLRERNTIFREALRVMSHVTLRELEELRARSMRLDCEMIRVEGDLRHIGCRLDVTSPTDDAERQESVQVNNGYRSKGSASNGYNSSAQPQMNNGGSSSISNGYSGSKYGGGSAITNPSILEATMAVEALTSKYFGNVASLKNGHQRQPSATNGNGYDYDDPCQPCPPPPCQPLGSENYSVKFLLNRINELEHRVHELSETRASASQPQHMSRISASAGLGATGNARGSSAQGSRRVLPLPPSPPSARHRPTSADMWPVIRQLEEKLDLMTKKTLNEEEMFVVRDLLKRLRNDQGSGSSRTSVNLPPLSGSTILPRRTRSPSPLTTSASARGVGGASVFQKRDLSAGRRLSPQRASSLADWLHQPAASSGIGESLVSQTRSTASAYQQMRPSISASTIANSIRMNSIERPAPACLVSTGYPAPLAQAISSRGRSVSPPRNGNILRSARLSPVMSGQRPSSPSQILGDSYSAISDDRPSSPYYTSTYSKYASASTTAAATNNKSATNGSPTTNGKEADSSATSATAQASLGADSVQGKRPFVPRNANDVRLGDVIKFTRQGGRVARGVVRYVGHLPGREEVYLGVELEAQDGKHDGTYEGRRYFKCKPNKGVFVAFNKVVIAWGDA